MGHVWQIQGLGSGEKKAKERDGERRFAVPHTVPFSFLSTFLKALESDKRLHQLKQLTLYSLVVFLRKKYK
jgi:hypothetical protein